VPVLVGVGAQDLAAGLDADAGGIADPAGLGLGAASARDRVGMLGIAHADPAFGPGEQVVLAFGPLTVVAAGLAGAGAAGGADLLQLAAAFTAWPSIDGCRW
jgi:hypothetical protein